MLTTILLSCALAQAPQASAPPPRVELRLFDSFAADAAVARARERLTSALAARGITCDEGPGPLAGVIRLQDDALSAQTGADGFHIVSGAGEGATAVELRAHSPRGTVYAVNELARLVRLGRWSPGKPIDVERAPAFDFRLCSMHDNPGEPRFDTKWRDPKVVLDAGFNGMIVHGLAGLCTYDAYDARLYPEGSPEEKAARATVLADRRRVKRLITEAKRNHLMVFLSGDQLCVPKSALALYGEEITAPNAAPGRFLLSPCSPRVHALVRATFEELMRLFPEVDGFQIRTGEVYTQSEPTLFGHTPTKGIHPDCADWTHEQKMRALIETITQVVCVENGKRFNFRAWGYWNSAHSLPEKWHALSDALEPHPLRTFSFKHVKTDHWRWNPINPNFGEGEHAQWAEFQTAREYEGKGAFPNYLGRYFADGPTEIAPSGGLARLHELGVRGAWCWARGGGWNGPYLKREEWVDLNVHALARLLWDPSDDPWRIAREWCALELDVAPDSKLADRFVEIAKLSEEAVLTGRYLGALIKMGVLRQGSGWTPDGNWSRDDLLGIAHEHHPARMLYDILTADEKLHEAIAERERAIELWNELAAKFEALVREANGDPRWSELRNTALYGKHLWSTASHGFIAGLKIYAAEDGRGGAKILEGAREHLTAAQRSWDEFLRACELPGTASAYHELGFTNEWIDLEKRLAALEQRAK